MLGEPGQAMERGGEGGGVNVSVQVDNGNVLDRRTGKFETKKTTLRSMEPKEI